MRVLLEEHGGVIATAAVVLIVIGVIVALGASGQLDGLLADILDAFSAKAQDAAGFGTP